MTQQNYTQPPKTDSVREKVTKNTAKGLLILIAVFVLVVVLAILFVKAAIWLGTILLASFIIGLLILFLMLRKKDRDLNKNFEERDLR